MSKADDWKVPPMELRGEPMHGRGSHTGTYYKVEFRNQSNSPQVVGDGRQPFPFVIDNYWRALPITRGATQWGVNIPIRPWDAKAAEHGLVSYLAAEAHRWAFLAALEAGAGGPGGALCVETRLVAVELHEEYSTREIGVSPAQEHSYGPPQIAPRVLPNAADEKAKAA